MKTFIQTIFALMLLSSCGNYTERKGFEESFDPSLLSSTSLDFNTVKELVFAPRCISCHQQYKNYESIYQELSAIQNTVESNRMPKTGGPLSNQQKAILKAWIAQGAAEVPGQPTPPRIGEELEPNWKSISRHIINPKCLVCHNPQGQAKFLDLSNRQVIFENRNRQFDGGTALINFENPLKSYIVQILQDEDEPMPPLNSNINQLTENELDVFIEWIKRGLP